MSSRSSVATRSHLLSTTTVGQPDDADPLGQPLVLVGGAHRGVDHQQGDVGPLQGVEGPEHRVVTRSRARSGPGGACRRCRRSTAGPRAVVDHGVDGVAGGAGHVVDDRPLLADQAVEQGRLARRWAGPPAPPGARPASPSPVGRARRASGAVGRRRQRGRTTSSSRSPVPRPWMALTGQGSPRPSETNSQAAASRPASSTLFTTSSTGAPVRRTTRAAARSSSVTPTVTSTTKQHQVGLGHGPLGLLAHLGVEGVAPGQPAAGVDQAEGDAVPLGVERPCGPGSPRASSSTTAARRPTMRLTSDDLPTLGRPATTTTGSRRFSAPWGTDATGAQREPPARRPAVASGTTSTGQRQVVQGQRRRGTDPPTGRRREAGSGRRASSPARARARSAPVSRPATPMLPPKKPVLHRQQLHVARRSAAAPSTRAP